MIYSRSLNEIRANIFNYNKLDIINNISIRAKASQKIIKSYLIVRIYYIILIYQNIMTYFSCNILNIIKFCITKGTNHLNACAR